MINRSSKRSFETCSPILPCGLRFEGFLLSLLSFSLSLFFLDVRAESRETGEEGRGTLSSIFNSLRFSCIRISVLGRQKDAIWFTVSIVASNYAFPLVEFLCGNERCSLGSDTIRSAEPDPCTTIRPNRRSQCSPWLFFFSFLSFFLSFFFIFLSRSPPSQPLPGIFLNSEFPTVSFRERTKSIIDRTGSWQIFRSSPISSSDLLEKREEQRRR